MKLQVGMTSFSPQHGYGRIEEPMADALREAGATILLDHEFGWDWRLIWGYPHSYIIGKEGYADDIILHTMFEFPTLPKHWPGLYNRFRLLWLPTTWCEDVYRNNGVTADIMVSGYGIAEKDFPELITEREAHDHPFTFLAVGHQFTDRKGSHLALEAFVKLGLKNARLLLKVRDPMVKSFSGKFKGEVEIVGGFLGNNEYWNLLAMSDVLVYPHWGEGFGLIPLEYGRTGLPGIVTDYSGPRDYLNDECWLKLEMRKGKPDVEQLMAQMLWCYEHQDDVRRMGRSVARYVKTEYTWEASGRKAYRKLQEHLGG